MKFGCGIAMMNVGEEPDHLIYQAGLHLAELAESLEFDSLWTVEHHFTGHSPVPNGLHLLSYIAGRTRRAMLGTAVIVLPWHDPVRVAEEIAMLDVLSGGRTMIGFGRGLSVVEFEGFRVPITESKARFEEAARIIICALSNKAFSYNGRFNTIPEIQIRPRPLTRPEQRLYGASHSVGSASLMGALGMGILVSPPREIDENFHLRLNAYKSAALLAGHTPKPPICHWYVSLSETRREAEERARRYMPVMFESLDRHYQFSTGRLDGVVGYEEHARSIKPYALTHDESTHQAAVEKFVAHHLVGTPADCISRLREVSAATGSDHVVGEFKYGGMPVQEAETQLRLFAEQVAPILRDTIAR